MKCWWQLHGKESVFYGLFYWTWYDWICILKRSLPMGQRKSGGLKGLQDDELAGCTVKHGGWLGPVHGTADAPLEHPGIWEKEWVQLSD